MEHIPSDSYAAPLALRMDDVGASTKRYLVYSKKRWSRGPLHVSGNWLFLKYMPPWKAWGPYRELEARDWLGICEALARLDAKLTVGITATWADSYDRLTPFPKRFPEAARVIREGANAKLLEIANHGLTHCVLENNKFRPRFWSTNRPYHREFWDWVLPEVQERHIRSSQEILQEFFAQRVVTFVPPGNVFAPVTLDIASRYGLRYVTCDTAPNRVGQILVLGNVDVLPFHDRDIVYRGIRWLEDTITCRAGQRFCLVRELAELDRPTTSERRP